MIPITEQDREDEPKGFDVERYQSVCANWKGWGNNRAKGGFYALWFVLFAYWKKKYC